MEYKCRYNFIVRLYFKQHTVLGRKEISTFPLQRHSAYFVRGERRVAASKNIKGPPPGHLGYFAEEKTFIV